MKAIINFLVLSSICGCFYSTYLGTPLAYVQTNRAATVLFSIIAFLPYIIAGRLFAPPEVRYTSWIRWGLWLLMMICLLYIIVVGDAPVEPVNTMGTPKSVSLLLGTWCGGIVSGLIALTWGNQKYYASLPDSNSA